jgi:hypothetical protein
LQLDENEADTEVEYLQDAAKNVDFSKDASDADLKQECCEDAVENANLQIVQIDESEI